MDNLLKNYIDQTYPQKIKKYKESLLQIKQEKLKVYEDVIYLSNGLMWQDNNASKQLQLNALEATIYCRNLHHATKHDWRVPNYQELLQLVNYFRYDPASVDGLKNIVPSKYWTSSKVVGDYSATWFVDFEYGQTGVGLRTNKLHVRCVRSLDEKGDEF